jgi:hypothetical protein
MSYDLNFYKAKTSDISELDIANYLSENLVAQNESSNEWFFENKDTDVYYILSRNEPENDGEGAEVFTEYDNTHFAFNLNFMRPSFFGLEAFRFIEKFITDLDLKVLNPQSDEEFPYVPNKEELFENWNRVNLWSSIDHFDELSATYISSKKSTKAWEYNFARKHIQQELGDNYFVPRIFFFRTKDNNSAVTISSLTQGIPIVVPAADYYFITRKRKKLFNTVEDNVLIDSETFIEEFNTYLEDYSFQDSRIIHPENAYKANSKFKSLQAVLKLETFAERIPMEHLYNAKPEATI